MHNLKKSHLVVLWRHMTQRRRTQFVLLLILMGFSSLLEMVGIGAVLPFLAVITSPEKVFANPKAEPVIRIFDLASPDELILPITVTFVCIALIATGLKLVTAWINIRISYATGGDLSFKMYRLMLYQPYAVHIARNSSQQINLITNKANILVSFIMTVASLVSGVASMVAILIALFIVDSFISAVVFTLFGLIYVVTVKITRMKLLSNSEVISRESTVVMKSLQEGLGGIRDILIDSRQEVYCEIYRRSDYPVRRALGSNSFINACPKYVIEAFALLVVATLAYSLTRQPDGVINAIPVLGVFAMGAQRIMPLLHGIYAAWSGIRGSQASRVESLEFLEQALPEHAVRRIPVEPMGLWFRFELSQLWFRYRENSPWILRNVNISISKGSCVGFIGSSGSGKSTLLDIIMGLLTPNQGSLMIDGKSLTHEQIRTWQTHIAHIPQVIFLADSTIAENIAFGVPREEIDPVRVRMAARQAQIESTIEHWPEKYQTKVGERGIQLSGGQRQRIGIARALYKKAGVLIFDEATNSLDMETESAVMEAIDGLRSEFTILIIAHRLNTLKGCSRIFEIENGEIQRSGTFDDICNQST